MSSSFAAIHDINVTRSEDKEMTKYEFLVILPQRLHKCAQRLEVLHRSRYMKDIHTSCITICYHHRINDTVVLHSPLTLHCKFIVKISYV